MPANVTLTIQGGSLDGTEFTFDEPARSVIGRSEDCPVRLPNKGWEFHMVSRHHCLLHIDPPHIRVRDLGSRNGTYINGRLIGLRNPEESPESAADFAFGANDLYDGDILQIGPVHFRVKVRSAKRVKPEAIKAPADSRAPKAEQCTKLPADELMFAI
jgi:eukaryotic-like serine/threonine-protein kinase